MHRSTRCSFLELGIIFILYLWTINANKESIFSSIVRTYFIIGINVYFINPVCSESRQFPTTMYSGYRIRDPVGSHLFFLEIFPPADCNPPPPR